MMNYKIDDIYKIMYEQTDSGRKYYIFNKLSNSLHESSPGIAWWSPYEYKAIHVVCVMFHAGEQSLEEIVLDV